MTIPPPLSDAFVDDLVSLLFCALPAMDSAELRCLLASVLRITAREVRRALAEERERQAARIAPHRQ